MINAIKDIRINAIAEIKENIRRDSMYLHPANNRRIEDMKRLQFSNGYDFVVWMQQNGILKNPTEIDRDYTRKILEKAGCKSRTEYNNKCAQNAGYKSSAERLRERRYKNGINLPMSNNSYCSYYIGIHVGEKIGRYVLSILLGNIKQEMPPNNPGFDLILDGDIKVDVKTRLLEPLRDLEGWKFDIKYNKITDYFLMIGLNKDKENLEILHIWLIKKDELIRKMCGQSYYPEKFWKRESITISSKSIRYFRKYDLIGNLDKNKLRALMKEIKNQE